MSALRRNIQEESRVCTARQRYVSGGQSINAGTATEPLMSLIALYGLASLPTGWLLHMPSAFPVSFERIIELKNQNVYLPEKKKSTRVHRILRLVKPGKRRPMLRSS
jgi:hypothetical protein